jgi:hypothetical protein
MSSDAILPGLRLVTRSLPGPNFRRNGLAVATASVLLAFALTARAQPDGTDAPRLQSAPAGSGTANAEEEAATRFKRGLELFDEGDYTLALVEFERAYQLAPNYRALYNIGLVNAQLGRYAGATRALERYLRDGGAAVSPERQAQVRARLADLKLRTATLDVSINVRGAEILLDNKPLDRSQPQGPMLIDAGEHTLRASAAGYEPALRTLTLAGGDAAVVRFDLGPTKGASAPSLSPARRRLFVPGLIGTGALAAGAITSGIVMLSARSNLTNLQNTVGSSPQARASAANEVNTAALVADVLTGLTIVGGGVTLFLSLPTESSPPSPTVSISPNRVVVTGTF